MAHRQRGTVLITVVMMVALATLIVTDIGYRQKLDIKRTAALISRDQSFYYLLSAEEFGGLWLSDDLKADNDKNKPIFRDSLGEDWAKELSPVGVPGGTIQGKITDLQARFNINSLFASDQQVADEQRRRLESLILNLQIPTDPDSQVTPKMLVDRIFDWIDEDPGPVSFDSREDLDYLNFDPPYRTAKQLIWDVSELLLIEGFTPDDIKKLAPFVCFLPPDTALNLNTVERTEIMALITGLDQSRFIEIRDDQDEDGFEDIQIVLSDQSIFPPQSAPQGGGTTQQPGVGGNPQPGGGQQNVPIGNFSIHSEYFLLEAKAIINQKAVLMEAIIYRPSIAASPKNSNIKIKTISRKLVDPLKRV